MALTPLSATLSAQLVNWRRGLLVALLAALYLVLLQGPDTALGRTLAIVHVGLFLLWQPFVQAQRRLSLRFLVALACVLVLVAVFLRGWMIALWILLLAGVVGGKVMLSGARSARLFYLLALAFLVASLLLMAAPLAVPLVKPPRAILLLGYVGLPLLLLVMALLPGGGDGGEGHEVTDFMYGLFIVLLLAVLLLGTLAAMLLRNSGYVEALLQTLLATGTMLLLLGLAWYPHPGFSGLGGMFSRYLMSIGLPIEQWLQVLTRLSAAEEDPRRFAEQACDELTRRLPWVAGGEWSGGGGGGRFGLPASYRWEFTHSGMVLVLHTVHKLSPTLIWHCDLLAQLLAQFHADKQRAVTLKQLSYMQAIHETGARLTHDVKNLLQSLNTLCSAGMEPGAAASADYHSLLRRQLPAIGERLAETLAKLNAPQGIATARWVAAAEWWRELRQRMAPLAWVSFFSGGTLAGELPAEVFSGVAENLMRNAAEKHLREPEIRAMVELIEGPGGFELTICDDGSPLPPEVAGRLFVGPVSSESGYGIGLYHAARYAEAAGYRLELAENHPGRVCFRLSANAPV